MLRSQASLPDGGARGFVTAPEGMDEVVVSVVRRRDGTGWDVLLELNGREWQRKGTWPTREIADENAAKILAIMRRLASRYKQ